MMDEMRLQGAPPVTHATEADVAMPHHIEDQDILANQANALGAGLASVGRKTTAAADKTD